MEYHFFKIINGIPRFFRYFVGGILIFYGVIGMLPVLPFGGISLILGLICFIPSRKIHNLRKIRRGAVHLFTNFSEHKARQQWQNVCRQIRYLIRHRK